MKSWAKIIFWNVTVVFVVLCYTSGSNPGPSHNKAVFCYLATYADHRPSRGNFKLEDVNPTLCTHLVYAFILMNQTDNSVYPLGDGRDLIVDKANGKNNITRLKDRFPHLKVTISIGGWQEGSVKYSVMAANVTRRSNFVNSTLDYLKKHDFDGIDLAWSYPGKRGGSRHDKQNFVELIKDLRKAFDPHNYILTAALDSSKDTMDYGYDIPNLSRYLDYMLVWSFDFHGSWSRFIGHNAPLYSNGLLSAAYSINYILKLKADPNKVIMGIPLFGRPFISVDPIDTTKKLPGLGDRFRNHSLEGEYTQEEGFLGYNEICLWFKRYSHDWKIFWDDFAKVPFAVNGTQFITYDDVRSVREKVRFSKLKKLGGVMVWETDTDDFRGDCTEEDDEKIEYPLLRAINAELTSDEQEIDNLLDMEYDGETAAVMENHDVALRGDLLNVISLTAVICYFNQT